MNWKAQSLPILINGLPHKTRVAANDTTDWYNQPKPSYDKIKMVSPYSQIVEGNYRTPTFMVHGNYDEWVPYQMSEKTLDALRARGIPAGLEIPDGCGHAFDLFPVEDRFGVGWASMEIAYDFACQQLGMRF